jgi:hypothetical protein
VSLAEKAASLGIGGVVYDRRTRERHAERLMSLVASALQTQRG